MASHRYPSRVCRMSLTEFCGRPFSVVQDSNRCWADAACGSHVRRVRQTTSVGTNRTRNARVRAHGRWGPPGIVWNCSGRWCGGIIAGLLGPLDRHRLLRRIVPSERASFAHRFDREQARERRVETDFQVAHRLVPRPHAIEEVPAVRDGGAVAVRAIGLTPRYTARLDAAAAVALDLPRRSLAGSRLPLLPGHDRRPGRSWRAAPRSPRDG